jgi:hypothetical protein
MRIEYFDRKELAALKDYGVIEKAVGELVKLIGKMGGRLSEKAKPIGFPSSISIEDGVLELGISIDFPVSRLHEYFSQSPVEEARND